MRERRNNIIMGNLNVNSIIVVKTLRKELTEHISNLKRCGSTSAIVIHGVGNGGLTRPGLDIAPEPFCWGAIVEEAGKKRLLGRFQPISETVSDGFILEITYST